MTPSFMPTDPDDYRSIDDAFRAKILRYLGRLVGKDGADDLTQVVMLKVSQGLKEFRGEASLATWIYRIATNTALDRLRALGAEPRLQPCPPQSDEDADAVPPGLRAPSVEALAIRNEMSACIQAFIGRLPGRYASVLVLSELEGFKNAEVAEILGISVAAVKIRLHRARAALRQALEAGCRLERDADRELACEPKARSGASP
jgi:RNA polymerase sigma-70 factor (ECF subfamily)